MTSKSKSNFLLLLSTLTLLVIIGGIFLGKFLPSRSSLPTSPSSPSLESTSNWKTYTSKIFGVSFKYPADIFIYQGNPQSEAQYWSNKINGGSPMELDSDGVWLNLSVTKLDQGGYDYYSSKIKNDKPRPRTQTSSEVLKIIDTRGIKGVVYYDLPKPNSEVAYGYSAIWLKDKTLYKFFIAAFTEKNLLNYKNTFDQILSTFQFD